MGRLEMPVCARRRGGASLLAFGGTRLPFEGVLRGAQPSLRAGEKFSGGDAAGSTVRHLVALLVARVVSVAGPGQRGAISRGRECGAEIGVVHRTRAPCADRKSAAGLGGPGREFGARP